MKSSPYNPAWNGVKALACAVPRPMISLLCIFSRLSLFSRPGARLRQAFLLAGALLLVIPALNGCESLPESDEALKKNVYIELVDWHVSGLWVINCPVAWIRVRNYNAQPVKEVTVQYSTFDAEGKQLNQGTHTIENSAVGAGQVKNFAEQYLGLVNLHSEKLSVNLLSVAAD